LLDTNLQDKSAENKVDVRSVRFGVKKKSMWKDIQRCKVCLAKVLCDEMKYKLV